LLSIPKDKWFPAQNTEMPCDTGIRSLKFLMDALNKDKDLKIPELIMITDCTYDITGQEQLQPQNAGIISFSKIAHQEHLGIRIRNIDIDSNASLNNDTYGMIVNEIYSETDYTETAIRGSKRWKRCYENLRLDKNAGGSNLREGGVYLVTGGLGPIGVCIAELIASRVKANIVLTGNPKHVISEEVLGRIKKLESSAVCVMIRQLDLLKQDELIGLSREIKSQFGEINGIFHTAGSENNKLFRFIHELNFEEVYELMNERTNSLYSLEKVFGKEVLDFFIVSSSLAHVTGGIGLAGYAASDAAADAVAGSEQVFPRQPVTSVSWDIWQLNEPVEGRQAEMSFTAEEAAKILFMIAASPTERNVIISPVDLMHRVMESVKKPGAFGNSDGSLDYLVFERPNLRSDYAEPRNETDEKVIAIWQQALGIKGIGIHDNFFELGGNSLLAVHIVFNINQNLGVEIPMAELIKNPTVAFLSDYIETVKWMTGGNAEMDKAEGLIFEEIEI
jgi:acyl carrier protein/NADP-dependent 3-hydroxy acid dehydrogenase YdfG